MKRPGKRKPLVAALAALILATAGVAVRGYQQQPAPEGASEEAKSATHPTAREGVAAVPDLAANRALAREQLALIDQALAIQDQMARNAKIPISDPSFSLWERRKLETLRRAGAGKAEIVAAMEKYVKSLKQEEAMVDGMRQGARASLVDVYDVKFRRMEAEIWLNEEKAR